MYREIGNGTEEVKKLGFFNLNLIYNEVKQSPAISR